MRQWLHFLSAHDLYEEDMRRVQSDLNRDFGLKVLFRAYLHLPSSYYSLRAVASCGNYAGDSRLRSWQRCRPGRHPKQPAGISPHRGRFEDNSSCPSYSGGWFQRWSTSGTSGSQTRMKISLKPCPSLSELQYFLSPSHKGDSCDAMWGRHLFILVLGRSCTLYWLCLSSLRCDCEAYPPQSSCWIIHI